MSTYISRAWAAAGAVALTMAGYQHSPAAGLVVAGILCGLAYVMDEGTILVRERRRHEADMERIEKATRMEQALEEIRRSGNASIDDAIRMQKIAAHAIDPDRRPHPNAQARTESGGAHGSEDHA